MGKKRVVWLGVLLILAGCAQPVAQTGHSSETQRSHAKQAQDELSSGVHK